MTGNTSFIPTLPPGCLVRLAHGRDVWKLLKLQFEFPTRNSPDFGFAVSKQFFLIAIHLGWIVVPFVFSYGISDRIGEFLISQIRGGPLSPTDIFILELSAALYGHQDGYSFYYSDNPNFLGFIFSFILTLILFLPLLLIHLRQLYSNTWVVECDQLIVASAKLLQRPQHLFLSYLYVAPAHRQRGIGSHLVRHIVQQIQQPVSLVCAPELVTFYTRLGFTRASQRPWYIIPGSIYMTTTSNTTLSPQAQAFSSNLSVSTHEYVIRQAQAQDIWRICRLLFVAPTKDFFLPFGITLSMIISIIILFYSFLLIAISVLLLLLLTTKVLAFGPPIPYLTLVSVGILVVTILTAIVAPFWSLKNYSQFWLLESRSKLIGYTRLSNQSRYSVVHHFYTAIEVDQSSNSYFMGNVVEQVTKPIYVACNRQTAKLYTNLGFTAVAVQNLPKKLRFGAAINLQGGGVNLVYLLD